MTRPEAIAYLIPQFPGQTHIFFWREISALEQEGCEVALFSTRRPPPGLIAHDWSQRAMERCEYLDRIRPGAALAALARLASDRGLAAELRGGGRGLLRDFALSLAAAAQLRDSCRSRGIDHVHVHSCGRSALIAALSRRLGGPRYSLTLHGPLQDYGPGQALKWRGAEFATVITRKLLAEVRDSLGPAAPDHIAVQPMGVDTDVLRRDAAYQPPAPGAPLRLFSCARLHPVKGHDTAMQAIRILRDGGIDARLDIAGEDDAGGSGYRHDLSRVRDDLDLADHVRLLGAIDAGAVRDHLCAAHGFVLASHAEPLGVAYMEAMSCGVPTIGTAAGGVEELVSDGRDGILVPPQDAPALAAAIRSLVDDPERARSIAKAGRERVVEGFESARGARVILREVTAARAAHASSPDTQGRSAASRATSPAPGASGKTSTSTSRSR